MGRQGIVAPLKLGVKTSNGLAMTFEAYTTEALKQMPELDDTVRQEVSENAQKLFEQHEPFRAALYVLWCLRAVLGPVVETLILVDRMCYMQEHGLNSELRVCFSGGVSPRNVIVVASRCESTVYSDGAT